MVSTGPSRVCPGSPRVFEPVVVRLAEMAIERERVYLLACEREREKSL